MRWRLVPVHQLIVLMNLVIIKADRHPQHAVIEHICSLDCNGETGALNEHIADVFAIMVTLWSQNKTTAESDWLIGRDCLRPNIKGVALRNMKFPGTAYDDPTVRAKP